MAGGWIKPRSGRLREFRYSDYLNSRNFSFFRFFCEEPVQGVWHILVLGCSWKISSPASLSTSAIPTVPQTRMLAACRTSRPEWGRGWPTGSLVDNFAVNVFSSVIAQCSTSGAGGAETTVPFVFHWLFQTGGTLSFFRNFAGGRGLLVFPLLISHHWGGRWRND
jgi:hypothetical protein